MNIFDGKKLKSAKNNLFKIPTIPSKPTILNKSSI